MTADRVVRHPDGRSLLVTEWGDPDGSPAISAHGTPGCRLFRARSIRLGLSAILRSAGVRLIAYDRPGYGGSDRNPNRRMADSASDIAAIADDLGVGRFAVLGGSGGSGHALAAPALLPDRVTRVLIFAPMAPYDMLGYEAYTRNMDPAVVEYIAWCRAGEDRMLTEFGGEDRAMRDAVSPDDPADRETFEQTRNGLWGWVDDELGALSPWGFDPATIAVPVAIWYDPDERVLPRQHGEWLAARIPGAELIRTHALGHGSPGDPVPEWTALGRWLVQG